MAASKTGVDNPVRKVFFPYTAGKRDFTTVAIAVRENEKLKQGFYGCDGVNAWNLGGFSRVFLSNIYGERIEKHCGCGHNLSIDQQILLLLRSIGGLSISSLSESEKEVAARAIECGYLRRDGELLEPRILVFHEENHPDFIHLLSGLEKVPME